jgi:hypothetical protein
MHVECGGEMFLKHTSVDGTERGSVLDREWICLARLLEARREFMNTSVGKERKRRFGREMRVEASAKEPRRDIRGANRGPWLMRWT